MFEFDPALLSEDIIAEGGGGTIHPYKKDGPHGRDDIWVVKKIEAKNFQDFTQIIQEALLGFGLDHPALLPLKGFSCDKKSLQDKGSFCNLYLLMDRMEKNLSDEIVGRNTKLFDEETLLNYFHTIASGVEYLHSKRIAHRDIKPHNILINQAGELKLADVGIARLVIEGQTNHKTVSVKGSHGYIAPEVLKRDYIEHGDLPLTDLWSLGIVFAELCLLELPKISLYKEMKDIRGDVQKVIVKIGEKKYSKNITELISSLLNVDEPKLRETARGVRMKVQDILVNYSSKDKFTFVKKENALTVTTKHKDDVSDRALASLVKILQELERARDLTELNLKLEDCRSISDVGVDIIAHGISQHLRNLHHLSLDFTGCKRVTKAGLEEIILGIGFNLKQITSFSLNFQECIEINGDSMKAFSVFEFRRSFSELQSLSLNFGWCKNITVEDVKNLMIYLTSSPRRLTSLELEFSGCKRIKGSVLQEVSSLIGTNFRGLQTLKLKFRSCQRIADKDIEAFVPNLTGALIDLSHLTLDFNARRSPTPVSTPL